MRNETPSSSEAWKTKPTDRFVLKWIKLNLSARVTPHLVKEPRLQPWMITVGSAGLGVLGGLIYALGFGWLAGLVSGAAQVLDGVDGQYARLTGRESSGGAFLDSVLDRYADAAMVMGMVIYLARLPHAAPLWLLLIAGFFALVGGSLISYTTARSESLDLDMGKPTLASKGTRTTVMVLAALGTVLWPSLPLLALAYLAIHPNAVVIRRLLRAHRSGPGTPGTH